MMAIPRPHMVAIRASATPPVIVPAAAPTSLPAEESEERGGRDAGVEGRHALLVARELLAGGPEEGVREGVEVGQAVDQDAGHGVLALLAEGEGAVDVALLDVFKHLGDDLGLALSVLADDEEQPLDDHRQADGE